MNFNSKNFQFGNRDKYSSNDQKSEDKTTENTEVEKENTSTNEENASVNAENSPASEENVSTREENQEGGFRKKYYPRDRDNQEGGYYYNPRILRSVSLEKKEELHNLIKSILILHDITFADDDELVKVLEFKSGDKGCVPSFRALNLLRLIERQKQYRTKSFSSFYSDRGGNYYCIFAKGMNSQNQQQMPQQQQPQNQQSSNSEEDQ